MSHMLIPCTGCDRHVRASDARCPFCDAALSPARALRARPPADPTARLGRTAQWLLGATLAVSGCASTVGNTDASDAPAPQDAITPRDTAQPDVPTTPDVPVAMDVPRDEPMTFPAYGGPFPLEDVAQPDAVDVLDDEGGNVFLYGGPPPPPDVTRPGE